jgi:hypothetical protein
MLLTATALSLSLLAWLSGPDLPQSCPVSLPAVTVIPMDPGFTVDHDKTRSELGGMIGRKAFPGFYTQGLTDVTYATAPRFLIESQQLADGRWCATLQQATIEFGLSSPASIHIASEIPEGSCRYVSVLAHERRHVAISQRAIEGAVDALRAELDAAARSSPSAVGQNEEAASGLLKASLQKVIEDVTRKQIAQADFDNALIDTRDSYAELTAQCPGSQH